MTNKKDKYNRVIKVGDMVAFTRYGYLRIGAIASFTGSGNPRVAPLYGTGEKHHPYEWHQAGVILTPVILLNSSEIPKYEEK